MRGFFYAQSEYSLLDNTIFLKDLVEKSKEYGYDFIALADNNMHAAYKFFKLCKNNDIKPIIGLKTKLKDDVILLYSYNNEGYRNLLKISSQIALNGFISLEEINNKGIFAISPGIEGKIEKCFIENNLEGACEALKAYTRFFEIFYLGIQNQNIVMQSFYDDLLFFARKNNVKTLPIHKTSYLDKDDFVIYEAIKQIGNEKAEIGDYYLKKKEELDENNFDNVEEVFNMVNVSIEGVEKKLPTYPNNLGLTSSEYLNELCYLGLKKRLNGKKNDAYFSRLEYELSIIKRMGYEDYFLIVCDFVKYAKKNNVLVGPGRGSAAGSLVSYVLGITNVDPIEYGLLFERFLNPERITMPDIDMDFPDDKREMVIEYVINKYGIDHVCNISTFGHFQSRLAIRDVARIKNIPDYRLNEILKYIDNEISLKENLKKEEIIKLCKDDEIFSLLDIASRIEGLPKLVSTHAAGLILSSDTLTNNCAIMKSTTGIQSQFEASDLEELGLLKIDFLGLKNLTFINDIINKANVKINDISLKDSKTYELLSSGLTNGVFQLESQGMKRVLKKLKPNNIEDLVAVLALYRPGPMDQIDEYIERKNGKEFTYLHPLLKNILKSTYGIIVYQEQIMKIASEFAGYSLGEADILRRAVSKKKTDVLINERKKFVERCKCKDSANEIYDYIVKFADYGFNRNHSVPYALISYQMAYLKANYPKEFVSVLLNDCVSDNKKTSEFISELKKNKIEVENPNINYSSTQYEIVDNKVILPLTIVKNVGTSVAKAIIEERKKGLFTTYTEFKRRVNINEKALESLIFSSALDCFNKTKKELAEKTNKDDFGKYNSDIIVKEKEEYEYNDLSKKEFLSLGFNLKYSKMALYSLQDYTYISEELENGKQEVIGYFKSIKEIKTKSNEQMAFILISDDIDVKEVVVFPKAYAKIKEKITNNEVYISTIIVSFKKDKQQIELIDIKKV